MVVIDEEVRTEHHRRLIEWLGLRAHHEISFLCDAARRGRAMQESSAIAETIFASLRYLTVRRQAAFCDPTPPCRSLLVNHYGSPHGLAAPWYGPTANTTVLDRPPRARTEVTRRTRPHGADRQADRQRALPTCWTRAGQPVPVGVSGELYRRRCRSLARGYLRRVAAMTAERFLPDPVRRPSPARACTATGDLVRWRRGAEQIDFLGRIDDQVKVRGFRIELGEMQRRCSSQHP